MRKTGGLNDQFAALLRSKREARQLSLHDFAARIGVSGEKVEMWESGRARPGRDKWVSIANALGITLDQLMRGEATRRAEPAPDLATQVGRLVAAFMVCEPGDRQVLLRSAEFRARGRTVGH